MNETILKMAQQRADAMNDLAALPTDEDGAWAHREMRVYLENKIADLTSQLEQHCTLVRREVSHA